MKLKTIFAWALALLLALAPLCAYADDLDDVWSHVLTDSAFGDALVENAGSASDNYVLCLIRLNKSGTSPLDFAAYIDAAAAKLEAGISNASTRQRTALALIASGAADRVPANLVDDSAGQLGVMSWIWALHLVLNGAPSELWTADAIVQQLLDMQLEDGGWKVTGEVGDVDVTSMCLQALAYCGIDDSDLDGAIQRGLEFLSARQLESGGFASMGNENAESSAQVLTALASLGIEPDDERFIKGGRTPLDAMLEYRLPSGGFRHLIDGEESSTATSQALQALIALQSGGVCFYDFSDAASVAVPAAPGPSSDSAPRFPVWKLWAFAAIGVLAMAGIAFSLTRRHGRIKQLAFVLIVAAAAFAAVWFVRIDSTESYYDPDAVSASHADGTVMLSIRCDSVAGLAEDGNTPEDGVILPSCEIPFVEGETVFDALTVAVRTHSLQMEHTGDGEMAYINGINNLYEFDYGDLSGWIYSVNGEIHSTGCGSYRLSDGDEILWQYTTELGEDL